MITLFKFLLILIFIHLIADFVLQDDFQAMNKGKNKFIMFVHVAIWSGSIGIILSYLGLFEWWKLLMLFIGHYIIDIWKSTKIDKTYALTRDLWIDQSLHLIQLIICLI